MKPHIEMAHHLWAAIVRPGDTVVDATIGNGHDTFFLAKLLKGTGKLVGYDIQSEALLQTKQRLLQLSPEEQSTVFLRKACHHNIKEKNIKLIVYNLGYLPGGDKSLTTRTETTLKSIQKVVNHVVPGGAISITCYPGHTEGAREQKAILIFLENFFGLSLALSSSDLKKHSQSILEFSTQLSFGLSSSDSEQLAPQNLGFSGEANGQMPFSKAKIQIRWNFRYFWRVGHPFAPTLIWLQHELAA
jgi:hypothetical protein